MTTDLREIKRHLQRVREEIDEQGLAPKQVEATRLLASPARHILLYGGARSMKTFVIVRAIVLRAIKADDSRHLIARFRFNHVKQYIGLDTLPTVMKVCFPGIPHDPSGKRGWRIDKSDWYMTLPNGSEIWLGGLDEKERTEKILGAEYATVGLNEVSQISWQARNMVITRLAQKREFVDRKGEPRQLALKAYYDCNPPPQSHWSYRLFMQKEDPVTRQAIPSPDNYAAMMLHPRDNPFISEDFIEELATLPDRQRRRFLDGEWLPATENALWNADWFDEYRIAGGKGNQSVPDMQRIVIGVDPSGADDDEEKHNDDIGIVVVGLGTDGKAYVLEDLTLKSGPRTWGGVVAGAYDRHGADLVVGETNFGGEMVRFVVQAAKPNIPFKPVTASRGKVVRAEPIAALYEQGKVHHVSRFPELEDELLGYTTAGYTGARSPNRADALVWALSELFPGMVRKPKRDLVIEGAGGFDVHGW